MLLEILSYLPCVVFAIDLIYFLFSKKRMSIVIRFIFEFISLIVFPLIFYIGASILTYIDGTNVDFFNVITYPYFAMLITSPLIFSYFMANYGSSPNSKKMKLIMSILLTIGLVINIILSILLLTKNFSYIYPLIGNFPLVLAFTTTLLYYHRKNSLLKT